MSNPHREAVEAIRDLETPVQIFTVCTGGGAGLSKFMWDVPGCSRFLVGTAFPYAPRDTTDFLGFEPEKFCSQDTALHLAMEAYYRAWEPKNPNTLGMGLTAVVATNEEHRGAHRIYVATVSDVGCKLNTLIIPKGTGRVQRDEDGLYCDLLGLTTIAETLGVEYRLSWKGKDIEALDGDEDGVLDRAKELFFQHPYFTPGRTRKAAPPSYGVSFPGAFNPPHEGHYGILDKVRESGTQPYFAITTDPPHKDALSLTEMLQRAKLLKEHGVLFSQGDQLYIDKARRWGNDMVIGADALLRMVTWEGAKPAEVLKPFLDLGVSFYVVGREIDGEFVTLDTLDRDEAVSSYRRLMFKEVEGRWDTSSTELRKAASG